MKFGYLLLAAAVVGAPVGAKPAPRTVVTAKADPAALKLACDRLAALLTPDSAVPHQVDNIIASMLQAMLQQDASFAAMNQKYPGMSDAIGVRVRPLIIDGSKTALPLYRTELSQLYCDSMTLADATTAAAIFESGDGQVLLTTATANMSYKASFGALAQGGDASAGDVRADLKDAAQRTVDGMSPAQLQRASRFFASPAGRKMIATGPRKTALEQKWFNYSPPGLEGKVASATAGAMVDHIGKTDPALAVRLREALVAKGVLPKS